jgi:hypothetical protein
MAETETKTRPLAVQDATESVVAVFRHYNGWAA